MLGLVLLAFRLALVLTSLTPCTALPSRSLRYFLLSSCRTNPLLAPNLARNLPLALIRDSMSRDRVLFAHAPSPVGYDGIKNPRSYCCALYSVYYGASLTACV